MNKKITCFEYLNYIDSFGDKGNQFIKQEGYFYNERGLQNKVNSWLTNVDIELSEEDNAKLYDRIDWTKSLEEQKKYNYIQEIKRYIQNGGQFLAVYCRGTSNGTSFFKIYGYEYRFIDYTTGINYLLGKKNKNDEIKIQFVNMSQLFYLCQALEVILDIDANELYQHFK